ncbi:GNAT family N-acetyltransferase [Planomonospora parontospora]|uniref:GNAT family N-acetyltransferase n=1 Tax=Planomonospora parontospora TaxID=58119 RepID=UPI00166FDC9E|nr:hypothetical protein [Planomonospora parontospora]
MTIRTATPDDAALLAELNRFVRDIHVEHRPDLFRDRPPSEELAVGFRSQLEREDVTIFIAERPEGGAAGSPFQSRTATSWFMDGSPGLTPVPPMPR